MFLQLIRLLLTDDVIYLQLTPRITTCYLSSGPSFLIKGDQILLIYRAAGHMWICWGEISFETDLKILEAEKTQFHLV